MYIQIECYVLIVFQLAALFTNLPCQHGQLLQATQLLGKTLALSSLSSALHPASISGSRESPLGSPPMSFTPPSPPWLRLPSYCYLMQATAPLLTWNPAHKQNLLLGKWRQQM